MRNLFVSVLALSMFLGGTVVASAETSDLSSLTAQIQNLLQQVNNLQTQLAELQKQQGQVMSQLRETLQLTKSLYRGMSDEEVTELQELLASDSEVYPEGLVTGYFGVLTEKAVKKFQKKYGIEQVGVVGPKTRAALKSFWSYKFGTTTTSLPSGLQKKAQYGYTWNYNWASTTSSMQITGHKVAICHKGKTIMVALSALQAHLNHGDSAVPCGAVVSYDDDDDDGDDNDDNLDTIAPILSNILATSTTATSTNISWDTNENAKGFLWYDTVTPLATSTATKMEDNDLEQSKSFDIVGLATSTTYYYMISAEDEAGNSVTTSESSFTTLSE